ncbi:hypothetical protein ElyMa_003189000 [Elysia marginata]|uniref:Uncharacterized protein n=1 Tax=Elysia marginata TaxID=1093978 RepID=A0AAV4J0K1_9GAST|nr:hypothetical protein ElyMa_003189000 [Elysia marginata]
MLFMSIAKSSGQVARCPTPTWRKWRLDLWLTYGVTSGVMADNPDYPRPESVITRLSRTLRSGARSARVWGDSCPAGDWDQAQSS